MPDANAPAFPDRPSFGEAFVYWLKLGCLSFGGPAGQIAMMQTDLVDRHKWIGQGPFLRGLSFATLLPGPEAQQLATYIGWRLHGPWGGIVAGGLFVLPGALAMLVLSWIAAHYGDTKWVGAVFDGLKPVVVAIVAHAVWRIGKKALTTWQATALAGFAFGALYFADMDFPWVVAIAAAIGAFASRWGISSRPPVTPSSRAKRANCRVTALGASPSWSRSSSCCGPFRSMRSSRFSAPIRSPISPN